MNDDVKPKRRSYIAQLKHDLELATTDEMRAEINARIESYKLKKNAYYKENKSKWSKK